MSKKFETLLENAIPANPKKGWLKTAKEIEVSKDWLNDAVIIGIKILDTLKAQGMTQRQLAERLGVTPQAITKIVKAKQNLTLGTIRKLEAALGVSLISIKNPTPKYQFKTKLVSMGVHDYNASMTVYKGNIRDLDQGASTKESTVVSELKSCA